jgi:hypothetical protein
VSLETNLRYATQQLRNKYLNFVSTNIIDRFDQTTQGICMSDYHDIPSITEFLANLVIPNWSSSFHTILKRLCEWNLVGSEVKIFPIFSRPIPVSWAKCWWACTQ